jgi:hypothetical protein
LKLKKKVPLKKIEAFVKKQEVWQMKQPTIQSYSCLFTQSFLKRKSDAHLGMGTILMKTKPVLIQSDNGTEFISKEFQHVLDKHNEDMSQLLQVTTTDRVL